MVRIGVLIFPGVQQLDLTGPYEVFASWPEARIDLLWKDTRPLDATTGLRLQPTNIFLGAPQYDVICVPGGRGINPLLLDDEVLNFLRAQAKEAQFMTSVCTGALVLGAAGLLRGKRATTHWSCLDLLEAFGAIAVNERIVRDGRLLTGGGVTAGVDFALALIAELAGVETAQAIQLRLEYAPQPPFDAGRPETAPQPVLDCVRAAGAELRAERERLVAAAARRLGS